MNESITKDFLLALDDVEAKLSALNFTKKATIEESPVCFVCYLSGSNEKVEFLFGPPQWDIDKTLDTHPLKTAFLLRSFI